MKQVFSHCSFYIHSIQDHSIDMKTQLFSVCNESVLNVFTYNIKINVLSFLPKSSTIKDH